MIATTLHTQRLILRPWQTQDLLPFAKLNADSDVMAYYPNVLSTEESHAMARKLMGLINQKGWGFWALEIKDSHEFIGFVGLHEPTYELPVTPCTEIGWRLAKEHWGKGYATEAANAALDFAFKHLHLKQVYSFASVINTASIAVMIRINMHNTHKNFPHPMVPKDCTLSDHVLYKISADDWS